MEFVLLQKMKCSALLAVLCVVLATALAQDPFIWPLPQQVTSGKTTATVSFLFEFTSSSKSEVIKFAVERYSHA